MNPNWKKIKKLIFIFLLAGFIVSVFPLFPEKAMGASYSPHSVPSDVRKNWSNTLGGKQFKQRTGRKLVYDVYSKKFTSGGYQIVNKNFGNGNQPYLNFQGWAVLQGRKRHTSSNHDTYIVAQKVGDLSNVKIYKTDHINLSATEELEYNNQGSGVWNECPANAENKDNQLDCNMRYDNVGFNAYLPLNELFPNYAESASWRLYIVKVVDGHIVYTPLILPFSFDNRSYGWGEISLSSGINANQLTMVGANVIRRDYPRQTALDYFNKHGKFDYFTTGSRYTQIDSDESGTGVWYGVRSTHDNNAKRWAVTAYWDFGGEQAILKYTPENEPPQHIAHQLTGNQYTNGNDYWAQPNTQVKITLRQYDKESGNRFQYLRLYGSGVDVRLRHDFEKDSTNTGTVGNGQFVSPHVNIDSARRTENTKYGRVEWQVTPKTHGHNYDIHYYYQDLANNTVGYNATGMRLRVDGVAPTLNDSSISGARYINEDVYWIKPNDNLTVSIRQHDGHSGNKFQYLRLHGNNGEEIRGRHTFAQSSSDLGKVGSFPLSTNNVSITKANRTENSAYGKVNWTINAKTHGTSYDVYWHFRDNVNNDRGYDTGVGKIGTIAVDGVAPNVQYRNKEDTTDFNNSDWQTRIDVRLKFNDSHSGYKRSRYAWSTSSTKEPDNWSNWTTSSNYIVSQQTTGEWYLWTEKEDNVGNVNKEVRGPYIVNKPPIADFDYFPNPIYEGDTLILKNRSTDPDDHPLKATWTVTDPDGQTNTYNDWDITIEKVKAGEYTITLKVSDIYEATDEITKIINIIPLTITGMVEHTDYWKTIHEYYGHSPNQFYSGERFILKSLVTNHPKDLEYVKVTLNGYKINNELFRIERTLTERVSIGGNYLYNGDMYEDFMTKPDERIKNGTIYFHFQAKWNNGIIKNDIVPVEIIGDVFRVYDLHRTN